MIRRSETELLTDPLAFQTALWPNVRFYDKQQDVIQSVVDDDMTVVPAGNMLGKDFVAAFIAVWYFLSRKPCRIVTTSAKDDHLRVLWGEINNYIQTSSFPLTVDKGGPLIVNHREIKRRLPDGSICPVSYIRGMVASADSIASMQGHHVANVGDGIPRTLFIADEASSVPDDYWKMARTWAKRALIIGNPWDCANFFFKSVKGDPSINDPGGNLFSEDGRRCYRRVIRIRAEDSPNVRLGLSEKAKGRKPSYRQIIPGVKDLEEYEKNRLTWDPIQQCVSLDGDFYEGSEVRLYPPDWLRKAQKVGNALDVRRRPKNRWMGIDVGEGGDDTVWTVIDEQGILFQEAIKTPDTSVIPTQTIDLIKQYQIDPKNVLFDRGGGGYEHTNYLRKIGYQVRSMGFGEAATDPFISRRMKSTQERTEQVEVKYVYRNRRAEMYGMLRELINPMLREKPFGIPSQYTELLNQLRPLPLQFDQEGRMYLPPKDRRSKDSKEQTLKEMLGCSPDEADSLVLATFAMERVKRKLVLKSY